MDGIIAFIAIAAMTVVLSVIEYVWRANRDGKRMVEDWKRECEEEKRKVGL